MLLLYYNDFEDNIATERYSYPKPIFQSANNVLQLTNVPVPHIEPEAVSITEPPPARTWSEKSQLLNFALDNLGKIISSTRNSQDTPEQLALTDTERYAIAMTEKLLQSIQDFCRARNTNFHVVFLMTINTDEKPAMLINQLGTRLQQDGIAYSFYHSKQFPRTDLWLDTHYTPYGQKLLAEHIEKVLSTPPAQSIK